MSRPAKTVYKTTNWHDYTLALKQRGSLTVFPTHAIQASLTLKILFGMALRQATGFVASLLKLAGLGWSVPDFSTLSRR